MGIKIVSQPIGAPIIAAASTAMAQANERTAQRQSEMWQQQVQNKYRTKLAQEEDTFNFGRQQALAPTPAGVRGNLRAATAYGKLQDEARNIYSGLSIDPHSKEAQERLAQIAEDMRMLREVNPDPTPEESFDRGRIFLDPSGSRIGPDGMPYTKPVEGGSELRLDPKTGEWAPPPVDPGKEAARKAEEKAAEKADAAKEKAAEKADAAKEKAAENWVNDQKKFADDERKRQLDELKDQELPDAEKKAKIDAINAEYKARLESLNNYMQNYGIQQPATPAAPVDAQVPTGEQLVGGALGENFGMTTPGGGVLKPTPNPGTPASGAFPPGADPYKTNDENFEDVVQSIMARYGVSREQAWSMARKKWVSTGFGAEWNGSEKGGLDPDNGRDMSVTTESEDAGAELTKMMDAMQRDGRKFEDLTPAEQARWIELERIYKGE